jgi:hypothetical protein
MEDLIKKLLEIQNLQLKFPKTAKGYNYKYVPLDEMWDKLLPELKKRKLLVVHVTENNQVVTMVLNEDGSSIKSAMPLPENLDPQKLGSAVTYYKRYNLGQIFNIMTDEDDDASSVTNDNDFEL